MDMLKTGTLKTISRVVFIDTDNEETPVTLPAGVILEADLWADDDMLYVLAIHEGTELTAEMLWYSFEYLFEWVA